MTAPSDLRLLRLQADALFTHDARGRIQLVNEPGGERAPRFFFGRTREGNLWRYRDDVSDEAVRTVDRLASEEPITNDLRAEPRNLDAFLAALAIDPECATISSGPAYRFPDELPPHAAVPARRITRSDLSLLRLMTSDLDAAAREFAAREPHLAVIVDGVAVALCNSARLTDRAAEAGVDTLEPYRGRGYASAVVSAWARAIRATGRIPLYSTSWDNAASQAVARRLGLIHYGSDLSLTRHEPRCRHIRDRT